MDGAGIVEDAAAAWPGEPVDPRIFRNPMQDCEDGDVRWILSQIPENLEEHHADEVTSAKLSAVIKSFPRPEALRAVLRCTAGDHRVLEMACRAWREEYAVEGEGVEAT